VKFPPGFAEVSIAPVPGWTAKVTKSKSPDQVSTVTWTGTGAQGRIGPAQFQEAVRWCAGSARPTPTSPLRR
jgi:uncharacterized protein YcnI